MPIVAKSVIEARRAAAALRDTGPRPAALEPVPALSSPPPALQPPAASPPRRGHATRGENNKWQPTGNYEAGWCRPPEATRFKKGGKPGPGRPKGSVSQDTLLKRELEQKQRVRINGREQNVSYRHLVVKKEVLAAVEGKDRNARKFVLTESARLYAGETQPVGDAHADELSASDALSVKEFIEELRRDLRAEIERELAASRAEQAR